MLKYLMHCILFGRSINIPCGFKPRTVVYNHIIIYYNSLFKYSYTIRH